MMSTGTCELKLYARAPEIIFSKKTITNMRFGIIYILVQVSFFGGLLEGVLASVLFNFCGRSIMVAVANMLLLSPPPAPLPPATIKKLPMALILEASVNGTIY